MRKAQRSHWRVGSTLGMGLIAAMCVPAMAQVVVNDSGQPSYRYAIKVPPGAGGFSPEIALVYDGVSNGVIGRGWRIEGIPSLARCHPTRSVDGASAVIKFSSNDKLCLNGERLIQTDADGNPLPFPQTNDASSNREYRTERDKLSRIRTSGQVIPWDGDGYTPYDGPAQLKVWTRDGRIQTIKASLNQYIIGTTAPKPAGGRALVTWPFVSETDKAGNVINYTSSGWGQFFAPGTIGYNGVAPNGQYSVYPQDNTTVVFNYEQLPDQFFRQSYYRGSLNSLTQRVSSIDIKTTPSAVSRRIVLEYSGNQSSGNLLTSVKECVGTTFSQCLPATIFGYTSGGGTFVAAQTLGYTNGDRLLGDFDGDGRTDIVTLSPDHDASVPPSITFGAGGSVAISNGANIIKRPNTLVVADFDGDGLDDIFVMRGGGGFSNCQLSDFMYDNCSLVFRSNGNGAFQKQVLRLAGGAPLTFDRSAGTFTAGYMGNGSVQSYRNFLIGDFNADGRLDFIDVAVGTGQYYDGGAQSFPTMTCASWGGACSTLVYLGNGDGTFVQTIVTLPTIPYIGLSSPLFAQDINADGVPDIAFGEGSSFRQGYFAGDGNLNFSVDAVTTDPGTGQPTMAGLKPNCTGVELSGDFNGDGLQDSACFASGTLTVHTFTGVKYLPQQASVQYGSVIGTADFDADGQTDFLLGAGGISAFRIGTQGQIIWLGALNGPPEGISSFKVGNFSGRGGLEFILDSPFSSMYVLSQIYRREDPIAPGLLSNVTEPSGAVTTLTYEGLAGTTRHASDRGTSFASVYPLQEPTTRPADVVGPGKMATFRVVDTVPPSFVVTKVTSDTGVGTAKTTTELAYRGYKSDLLGRGALGFREIRRQTDAPDGTSKLTSVQQRLQTYPYTGAVSVNENYLGVMSPIADVQAGLRLSRTENTYCDLRAAAGAEASATVTAPCPVTSKVLRPYARKTVQSAWDLNGTALPVTTTTNTYTGGYPTLIDVQTVGSSPAGTQTFVSATANEYFPDSISGDNWLLGLLKKSTVTKTVPNSLGSITTSAGTAPKATATAGP